MSDIVEKLRKWSVFGYGYEASCDMKEAAETITTLRAEVERLTSQNARLVKCLNIARVYVAACARLSSWGIARRDAQQHLVEIAALAQEHGK